MNMALWGGIAGITGIARRCVGLWAFLTVRAKGRTAVELERERNRATAEVIGLLAGGDELLEYEPGGRLRVIRKSQAAIPGSMPAGMPLPAPGGELDR